MKRKLLLGTVISLVIGMIGLTGCNKRADIVVAGKDYTEQQILTHILADLIEYNTDLRVSRKANLGGTSVVHHALRKGSVDIYVEYTGTAYVDILNHTKLPTEDIANSVYNVSKTELETKHNLIALDPFGFNNTYVMAIREDFALEHNLSKVSDLKALADDPDFELIGGFTLEFDNREDGIIGLQKKYDFDFDRVYSFDGSLRYNAIKNKDVHVIDAFATDSLIEANNLVTLEDDLNFFPPYFAFPLLNKKTYEKYPEILPLLASLTIILNSDEVMRSLNLQVDELQKEPREVAHEFLLEHGLIIK